MPVRSRMGGPYQSDERGAKFVTHARLRFRGPRGERVGTPPLEHRATRLEHQETLCKRFDRAKPLVAALCERFDRAKPLAQRRSLLRESLSEHRECLSAHLDGPSPPPRPSATRREPLPPRRRKLRREPGVPLEPNEHPFCKRATRYAVARVVHPRNLALAADLEPQLSERERRFGREEAEHSSQESPLRRVGAGVRRVRWHWKTRMKARLEAIGANAGELLLRLEDHPADVELDVIQKGAGFRHAREGSTGRRREVRAHGGVVEMTCDGGSLQVAPSGLEAKKLVEIRAGGGGAVKRRGRNRDRSELRG